MTAGSGSGSRFRYTGQAMLPEVQLYHYKARVYDSILGMFLQTDPIGYEDDLNLYAYVRNDPLNLADPSGRQSVVGYAETEGVFLNEDVYAAEGAYINFADMDRGQIWIGTLTMTREANGLDAGAGVGLGFVGGDVQNDLAGRSNSAEIDLPLTFGGMFGPSGEIGETSTGQPVLALEAGASMPGGVGNIGTTTTTVNSQVDVIGFIRNIPNMIREHLNRPGDWPER